MPVLFGSGLAAASFYRSKTAFLWAFGGGLAGADVMKTKAALAGGADGGGEAGFQVAVALQPGGSNALAPLKCRAF
jgi:hypothetical protein